MNKKIMKYLIILLLLLVISPIDLLPGAEIDDAGYGLVLLFMYLTGRLKRS